MFGVLQAHFSCGWEAEVTSSEIGMRRWYYLDEVWKCWFLRVLGSRIGVHEFIEIKQGPERSPNNVES